MSLISSTYIPPPWSTGLKKQRKLGSLEVEACVEVEGIDFLLVFKMETRVDDFETTGST